MFKLGTVASLNIQGAESLEVPLFHHLAHAMARARRAVCYNGR